MPRCRSLACFLFGLLLFLFAGLGVIEARLDPSYAGDSMLAHVRVIDFPEQRNKSLTLLLEPVADERLPARFRVSWFEPSQLPAIGEVWQLELRLRQPRGPSNRGGFSVEDWQFRERLLATGHVVSGKRNRQIESARPGLVQSWRVDFVETIARHAGESAAVLAAIGVGSRHLISADAWQDYAITGTSHLMAISGLHIGLAAAFASILVAMTLGIVRVRGNCLCLGIMAGAFVALVYAVVSGFAVPSQRAVLMLALMALAVCSRRRPDPCRILVIVATLVYVLDPLALLQPGFALSFAAVAVLLWSANSYISHPAVGRFIDHAIAGVSQLIRMQLTLLFGLLPLTVAIFDRVSILAPLVNLLVVPAFSLVVVPLTLLSLLTTNGWEVLSVELIRLAAACIEFIEVLIGFCASLPVADTLLATFRLHPLLLILPAIWVIAPRGWPGRWIALLATAALFAYKPASPRPGCVEVQVLDVGQGLAVLAQSSSRVLLYDTGAAFRNGSSIAESVILPLLRHQGIDRIDWLVASHADNDHAGGLPVLLDSLPVTRVFLGESIERLGRNAALCNAGDGWTADGISYRFLYPPARLVRDGNDASCVLSITAGESRLLLTGDIEALAEAALLDSGADLGADIVIVPHHGSLTSSTPGFVNRVEASLAIASAAYGNHWGFPKKRVQRRWQGAGATFLSTADAGAVSFEMCADAAITEPVLLREAQRRFWHQPAD